MSVEIRDIDTFEAIATELWQISLVTRLGHEVEDDFLYIEAVVNGITYHAYPEVIRLANEQELAELTIHAHTESRDGGRQIYYFCLLERKERENIERPSITWELSDSVVRLETSEDQSTTPITDMQPSARLALYGF